MVLPNLFSIGLKKMSESLTERENLIDFILDKGNGVRGLSQKNLKNIPKLYINPPEERLHHSQIVAQKSIPTIDVSKWDDPKIADSICNAATDLGFFQIINHGIPIEVLENVKKAAHNFFELPVEERGKYLKENSPSPTVELMTSHSPLVDKVLEWKDYLIHYCDGQEIQESKFWPSVSRDQVLEYLNLVRPLIKKLLNVLLKGLNTKELNEENESILMGKLVVDFIYYPICPQPDLATGVSPHSDVSLITVLLQDDVGGLYVREPGPEGNGWIHVTPVKGALVVNIGDVLQIMSNDKYKSVEHRVTVNGEKNRVSVPVFVNPVPNAVIGPLPKVLEGGVKPIYKQVVYSDYFNYFFSKGHDGKETIGYAKI